VQLRGCYLSSRVQQCPAPTAPNSRLPDLDVGSRAADVASGGSQEKFSGQHQGKRGCRCHDLQKLGHLFTPAVAGQVLGAQQAGLRLQKLGLLPNYEWLG